MKLTSDERRAHLLRLLSDGVFHSGVSLGHTLGVSRAAVANHIEALERVGIDVFRVKGKGYRVAEPLSLFDQNIILQQLNDRFSLTPRLNVLDVVTSTNDVAKENMATWEKGTVCIAQSQTAGRGRMGREWVSPFGASLYMSLYWRFSSGFQALQGLSLLTGIAVAESLERLTGIDIQLKWPNDIYANGRKLGGILVEIDGQMNDECAAIIGIGINLNMPDKSAGKISQPWIDLTQLSSPMPDRNVVAAELIGGVTQALLNFERVGFMPFVERWNRRNLYEQQPVTIMHGKHQFSGLCLGIGSDGGLRIKTDEEERRIYGGEVSLRGR